MRLITTLNAESKFTLSRNYNRTLQGMIYSNLDTDISKLLHEEGYMAGKRKFKLFVFSNLFGKYRDRGGYIEFDPPVKWYFSSPILAIAVSLISTLIKKGSVELEGNRLFVSQVKYTELFSPSQEIYTLSPIVVYSTLQKADGSKKTYYYSPFENEFSELITNNLIKKAKAMNIKAGGRVELKPIAVREVISAFKGTIIKGWRGSFEIKGDEDLIKIGYETGLGSKNSAGYGMFDFKAKTTK